MYFLENCLGRVPLVLARSYSVSNEFKDDQKNFQKSDRSCSWSTDTTSGGALIPAQHDFVALPNKAAVASPENLLAKRGSHWAWVLSDHDRALTPAADSTREPCASSDAYSRVTHFVHLPNRRVRFLIVWHFWLHYATRPETSVCGQAHRTASRATISST